VIFGRISHEGWYFWWVDNSPVGKNRLRVRALEVCRFIQRVTVLWLAGVAARRAVGIGWAGWAVAGAAGRWWAPRCGTPRGRVRRWAGTAGWWAPAAMGAGPGAAARATATPSAPTCCGSAPPRAQTPAPRGSPAITITISRGRKLVTYNQATSRLQLELNQTIQPTLTWVNLL